MAESGLKGDQAALAFIEATFADLDAWRNYAATDWEPEHDSELASDDHGWKPSPMSQLAKSSLSSAFDHLDAIRSHVETRRTFVFATDTLLRTALVAAAQAVWMIAPDDAATRQARGRTVAAETYRRHIEFLRDLQKRPLAGGSEGDRTAEVLAHAVERSTALAQIRASLGEKEQWQATAMIEKAAEYVWGKDYVDEARVVFRSGSGAAHGLVWSILGRPSTKLRGDVDAGFGNFVATGSLASIHNSYACAYQLTKRGWALLRQRGSSKSN